MIRIGEKVSFIPSFNVSVADTVAEKREKTISGRVIYVYRDHNMFCVKYRCGGTMQKETFKFSQIGQDVHRIGGGCYGS